MVYRRSSGSLVTVLVSTLMTMMATGGGRAGDDGKYPANWKGQWTRVIHRDVEVQGAFDQTKPWGRGSKRR